MYYNASGMSGCVFTKALCQKVMRNNDHGFKNKKNLAK
jgi:hypothetical protein